jgi:hypothetical protein
MSQVISLMSEVISFMSEMTSLMSEMPRRRAVDALQAAPRAVLFDRPTPASAGRFYRTSSAGVIERRRQMLRSTANVIEHLYSAVLRKQM